MSQEEYTLDQVALQFMSPRSEVGRLMDSGRLPWHLNAAGERCVARDQLEAFMAANGMPPLFDMAALQKRFQQDAASLLADPERLEQELAQMPVEERPQMAARLEQMRDRPDAWAAIWMERIIGEDEPDLRETPEA